MGNLEPSWGPQVPHKCCEENRENSHVSVSASLFAKILMKIDDFGSQGRPCTGLGQGLEIGVQKKPIYIFPLVHLGFHFRYIRTYSRLVFSVHF